MGAVLIISDCRQQLACVGWQQKGRDGQAATPTGEATRCTQGVRLHVWAGERGEGGRGPNEGHTGLVRQDDGVQSSGVGGGPGDSAAAAPGTSPTADAPFLSIRAAFRGRPDMVNSDLICMAVLTNQGRPHFSNIMSPRKLEPFAWSRFL